MNNSKRNWFYFTVIGFPLFFVLHAVNEQIGLLRYTTIAQLFLYYLVVGVAVAVISKLTVKSEERATVLTFMLLCIFFFFGAVKDQLSKISFLAPVTTYRYFLPITVVVVCLCFFFIKRKKVAPVKTFAFVRTLLLLFLVLEVCWLALNVVTKRYRQKDLGDIDNTVLNQMPVTQTGKKPFIFWIVLDEYSGGSGLKTGWNYINPLDSILRSKNFFVADSARSPYNYTHYSLASTLDMTFMRDLKEHSIIKFRDIVRGGVALQKTNVVAFLRAQGYDIINRTIYNVDDYPTKAVEYFVDADFKLIHNQTLAGRIRQDLGWNLNNMFDREADARDKAAALSAEARRRQQLLRDGLTDAKAAFAGGTPTFFMYHYMFTHEPFLYNPDGSVDTTIGYGMYRDRYISSIEFANRQLTSFVDSLKALAGQNDVVIILQGDHGYKFEEVDPLFDQEGCSILYSIYCSDLQYPGWTHSFNSVNSFRVLFNKYFHTNLPILENRSFNLFYR